VLRSGGGARGGFQPSTLAQTPRTAQRNLGTRSTKIESVSFRIQGGAILWARTRETKELGRGAPWNTFQCGNEQPVNLLALRLQWFESTPAQVLIIKDLRLNH
jgi:hypothetical protein